MKFTRLDFANCCYLLSIIPTWIGMVAGLADENWSKACFYLLFGLTIGHIGWENEIRYHRDNNRLS